MNIVTLVNRTDKVLHGTWDGRHHDIPPGESLFQEAEALAFKRQNPIMGSGDPRDTEAGMTGRMQYKIGIKEHNDPCTPLTTASLAKQGVERWNREKLVGARPTEVVEGDNGLYSVRSTGIPLSNDFIPPGK